MEKVSRPHDKYFRASMSDLRIAKSFLEFHLPKKIQKLIDWGSLKLESNHHVNPHLSESMTDVLYRVTLNNERSYISILVEHQSTVDPWMPFRVLCYSIEIMRRYIKQHPQKKLPLVIPLVFYSGDGPYTASTDLFSLFGDLEKLARETFLQPFQLIDLCRISDAELEESGWAGLMQLVQKRIWERDFLPVLKTLAPLLRQFIQADENDYVLMSLNYMISSMELEDLSSFVKIVDTEISSDIGESVMTLAEKLKEVGFQEGKLEGKLEGRLDGERQANLSIAKRMLEEGVEIGFITKITGVTVQDLKELVEVS